MNAHEPWRGPWLDITVLAPAHNEEENVGPLVREVVAAMAPLGRSYEFVVVDDGSTDETLARLADLMPRHPELRVIRLTQTRLGRGAGQSAALHAGIRAARGRLVAMLDADLQNDPADLPAMLDRLLQEDADMVQGDRSASRCDGRVRRASAAVGRTARALILGDSIRDTGCSLRIMKREVALQLPLQFRGMHRFIPATARDLGYRVVEMPVRHRPRTRGKAKYGVWNRALPGLIDCFAVRWMRSRRRSAAWAPVTAPHEAGAAEIDAAAQSEGTILDELAMASAPLSAAVLSDSTPRRPERGQAASAEGATRPEQRTEDVATAPGLRGRT